MEYASGIQKKTELIYRNVEKWLKFKTIPGRAGPVFSQDSNILLFARWRFVICYCWCNSQVVEKINFVYPQEIRDKRF